MIFVDEKRPKTDDSDEEWVVMMVVMAAAAFVYASTRLTSCVTRLKITLLCYSQRLRRIFSFFWARLREKRRKKDYVVRLR